MKKMNYLLSAVVVSIVLATTGCGSDDEGTQPAGKEVKVRERLSNSKKKWELGKVTLAGKEIDLAEMAKLAKFHIIFDDKEGKYTTNGNHADVTRKPNPWPASGTWKFKDKITDDKDKDFTITRDDGLDVSVKLDEKDEVLTLTFDFGDGSKYKTSTGKKVTTTPDKDKVKGRWVMTFKKEGVALKEAKARLFKTWKGSDRIVLTKSPLPEVVTDLGELEVTFADGKYTTNGNHDDVTRKPNPWPESGTWTFKDESAITAATAGQFVITRDDGLDIIVSVGVDPTTSKEVLGLIFTFDETKHKTNTGTKLASSAGASDVAKVKGAWGMSFAPKAK